MLCVIHTGDLVTLFDQFQSLAKIDDFKNKISIQTPDSSMSSELISKKLIFEIAKRRDDKLEKMELMIRYTEF